MKVYLLFVGGLRDLGESMRIFLCTWPKGGGGDPRDIQAGRERERVTKLYLGDAQGRGGGDLRSDRSKVTSSTSKLYLSQPGSDLPAIGRKVRSTPRPIRLLLSYHYYKDENVAELLKSCFGDSPLDIFADSGAYSAFSLGTKIPEEDYFAWVEKWKDCFDAVAGLDVIGDPKSSFESTERMQAVISGVPILPVFHVGEDWAWLAKILATGVDYIAFGGMVPFTRERKLLDAWLKKAWAMVPISVRVHGFGLTTWPLLLRYPWYSVDSSSWTAGFRYAHLALFDSKRGCFVRVAMGQKKSLLENAALLAQYGLRPTTSQSHSYDRDLLCGVCVESWQRAEEWLGTRKVFLVSASASANNSPQTIAAGARAYLSAGSAKGAPSSGPGAGNWPEDMGRALNKNKEKK